MSRKSTIDTKDVSTGNKMVVVLEKNRAGSQKKQEFLQSFTNQGAMNPGVPNPTTQLQSKVVQVSVNGAKSLKSKLGNNKHNPFYAGPTPKVLPIEINNPRLYNQIKTP